MNRRALSQLWSSAVQHDRPKVSAGNAHLYGVVQPKVDSIASKTADSAEALNVGAPDAFEFSTNPRLMQLPLRTVEYDRQSLCRSGAITVPDSNRKSMPFELMFEDADGAQPSELVQDPVLGRVSTCKYFSNKFVPGANGNWNKTFSAEAPEIEVPGGNRKAKL